MRKVAKRVRPGPNRLKPDELREIEAAQEALRAEIAASDRLLEKSERLLTRAQASAAKPVCRRSSPAEGE
jgi:hypothetical protein